MILCDDFLFDVDFDYEMNDDFDDHNENEKNYGNHCSNMKNKTMNVNDFDVGYWVID